MATKRSYVRVCDLSEEAKVERRRYMREYARARALNPRYKQNIANRKRERYNADPACRTRHHEAVARCEGASEDRRVRHREQMRAWHKKDIHPRPMTPEARARMKQRRPRATMTPEQKATALILKRKRAQARRRYAKVIAQIMTLTRIE